MTDRAYRFCEKHQAEPVQYCSLCLREMRLDTRKECADLQQKMEKYRESILGMMAKKDDEWP